MANKPIEIDPVDLAKKVLVWALVGVVVLTAVLGSFFTVGAGERGVVLTWGRAEAVAEDPGLGFKWPIAQKVVKISVQTQKYETAATAASKDLQDVSTTVAVNYFIEPSAVVELYKNSSLAFSMRIIEPAVQEAVKASTAQFTAEELITKRPAVKERITATLRERLGPVGLVVEDVSIVNFAFSAQFNQAIEAKVTAEQNALTEQNRLKMVEFQAQQKVAEAVGARDAQIAVAEGQARAIELTAAAEAEKIRLQNQELAKSPQYVELVKWQKWSGEFPEWYMVGADGSNLLMQVPARGVE